jgi:hypothetical protein
MTTDTPELAEAERAHLHLRATEDLANLQHYVAHWTAEIHRIEAGLPALEAAVTSAPDAGHRFQERNALNNALRGVERAREQLANVEASIPEREAVREANRSPEQVAQDEAAKAKTAGKK